MLFQQLKVVWETSWCQVPRRDEGEDSERREEIMRERGIKGVLCYYYSIKILL